MFGFKCAFRNKNENGFSAVELIFILVIVVLIGVVGYLVYKNHHQPIKVVTVTKTVTTPTKIPTTTSTSNPYVGWITEAGSIISFKIPSSWYAYNSCSPNNITSPDCYTVQPITQTAYSNALGSDTYKGNLILWETMDKTTNTPLIIKGSNLGTIKINSTTYSLIGVDNNTGSVNEIDVASCVDSVCKANLSPSGSANGSIEFTILPASENIIRQNTSGFTVPIDTSNPDLNTLKLVLQSVKF